MLHTEGMGPDPPSNPPHEPFTLEALNIAENFNGTHEGRKILNWSNTFHLP